MAQTGSSDSSAAGAGNRPGAHFGSILGIGLLELAVLLVLPLIAVFTRSWQTNLAAVIVLAVLLAALGAWAGAVLLRSRRRILHAPGVFLLVGTLAGLVWSAVRVGRLTVAAGRVRRLWPLFAGPALSRPTLLAKSASATAMVWLRVSAGVLAVMVIAGFLYEMLRRDRSSLILSMGTVLLFGASGWCAGGWLFLPLLLAAFPVRLTLIFAAVIFVFALALLTGVRLACVSPGSLPAGYSLEKEREIGFVLAVACLGLLGLMIPVLLVL